MITEKETLKKMTKKEIKEAYALDYAFDQDTNDYENYLTEEEMYEIALTLQYYDIELLSEEELDRLFYYCSLDEQDPEYRHYQVQIDNYDDDVRRIIYCNNNYDKKIVLIHYRVIAKNEFNHYDIYQYSDKKALGYLYLHKKEQYSHIFQDLNIDLKDDDEPDLEAIGAEIIYQSGNEFNFTDDYIVVIINE